MAKQQRAIDIWRQEARIVSAASSNWSDRAEVNEQQRWNWLKAMAAHLELGRQMKIPEHVLSYLFVELTSMDYDPDQAERAEMWLKYGDWTYRGKDPILQLSDFTPTEEQFRKAYEAAHARHTPKIATEPQSDPREILDAASRKWWALEIITVYEPKWGWKLHTPWIDDWRNSPAEHAHHLATRNERAAQLRAESERGANA